MRQEDQRETREYLPPRKHFGQELRIAREAAGLTQQQLGDCVVCHASLIAHFEAGRRMPRAEDAKRIDKALGTGGRFYRMLSILEEAKYAAHFREAAEAERLATAIYEHAVSLVPGILQTPDYARAVYRSGEPNPNPKRMDELVKSRTVRRQLLDNPESPTVWVVLSEAVLRTMVGGPAVMAEQLRDLARLMREDRIFLQVVPFSAGAHATMGSMVTLMSFDDAPDMAYVEGVFTGALFDDPHLVRQLRQAYDLTRAAALPPAASLALIESVAEDYENDC
ncbi:MULTISPECIES: helix-turn-helix transcriptional regulator [unclassified Streptomyces]|uniref:helix-turn-helix domain-containing protein n=1 Tax=unclassified Streptomyces TaxID=2593676 RepID=UPI00081E7C7D|nr:MULTISPECIES: helix-turn-helix transcriptional regulator [unclassified Streptomyces]MYZ38854.1 helix-turn-helix domain-containing protein [Streptomyces sp. SID4917]SCG00750.1 Helix-turn-helix domain-containing protein [Streptomyces sp. MnatMP-M17]